MIVNLFISLVFVAGYGLSENVGLMLGIRLWYIVLALVYDV